MIGIQYGFSLSTVWLANYVSEMTVVDSRKDKITQFRQILSQNYFDFSNYELEYQRMSKRYVQLKKDSIVDFVLLETVPEYHDDILKYAVSAMREDNAILVIKLSDEKIPSNMEQLIAELIPSHWLRYDSFIPDFLIQSVPFSQEQYIDQHSMSIWISRTKENPCQDL